MSNKVACYKPWTAFYVDNGTQGVKPCCWVREPLGYLNDEATLESSWKTPEWEQMRKDMWEANGELPKQCPIYCQHKLSDPFHEKVFNPLIEDHINNSKVWELAPYDFSATIANACNLKCKMCWIFDDFDYVISKDGYNRVLDQVKSQAALNAEQGIPPLVINLSGGEVFFAKAMRSTLYELVEDPNAGKTFKFNFVTNLTIWDQKFWDLLEQRPDSFSGITISIDGWDEESYLNIRGVDRFSTVMANLDKVMKWREEHVETHGYWPININSLIQTTTYPHLKDIIDLYMKKDTVVSFIPLILSYKPDAPWQCFNLPEHQRPCLLAIQDAIHHIQSTYPEYDQTEWKQGWQKWSILTSLQRNEAYLKKIIGID